MNNFLLFTDCVDTVFISKTIGAYKCAHALRSNDYSCLVVDHLHSFNIDEFKALIDKTVTKDTLAVGFSTTFFLNTNVPLNADESITYTELSGDTFFPQGKQFEQVAIDYIKSINPKCKILIGGPKIGSACQNRNVDYALIGFAESSIVNLANHLSKNTILANSVKNLWGVILIDDRYAASYDFKNTPFKWLPQDIVNSRVLPIEIGRGCIFKCKFCAYPMTGKKNLDFIKAAELLKEELQENYDNYGITTYWIVDDTFNDNEYKLNLIRDVVKQLTFQPIFWAYIRLDLLHSKKQIDILYDIGIRGFYFGVETLNKKAGAVVGKGFDPAKQIESIRELRQRYGNTVQLHGSLIIGLPNEDEESVRYTFDRLISQDIPLHSFDFKPLMIDTINPFLWSSEFSKNYKDYGYKELGVVGKFIDWQNEHMTFSHAQDIAKEFKSISVESDDFHISAWVLWSLKNFGHDNFEELIGLKFKEGDWHNWSKQKEQYIRNYKEQLWKLI